VATEAAEAPLAAPAGVVAVVRDSQGALDCELQTRTHSQCQAAPPAAAVLVPCLSVLFHPAAQPARPMPSPRSPPSRWRALITAPAPRVAFADGLRAVVRSLAGTAEALVA
jgi:hypothetical protein